MEQIIPKKAISVEHNWQKELANSFTSPEKLLSFLDLPSKDYEQDSKARCLFNGKRKPQRPAFFASDAT